MSNIYTPPGSLDFFGATFTSGLIYYDSQLPSANLTNSTSSGYSTISSYTANIITVPIAGDYVVTWNAGSSGTPGTRAFYQFDCTHASQVFNTTVSGGTLNSSNTTVTVVDASLFPASGTILIGTEEISYTARTGTTFTGCFRGLNGTSAISHATSSPVTYILIVGDRTSNITFATGVTYSGSWSRKVTFPVSGTWTLTPKWKTDGGSITVQQSSNQDYFRFTVLIHAINPLNSINQQLTKFLDSNYTLMTNLDANAYWGTLTSSGVSSSLSTNTNSVQSLTSQVNVLSSEVNNLSNTVSGLTSIAVTSGGIRIKP